MAIPIKASHLTRTSMMDAGATPLTNVSIIHSPSDAAISPMYLKIILTSGLFILTIAVSMLPLKCLALARRGPAGRRKAFQKVLSFLSCFAGGVFLGACFLDLFPEVKETMEEAIADLGVKTDFPIAEFVMVCGLFVVLMLEQIVVQYQERGLGPTIGHGHSHGEPSRPRRQSERVVEVIHEDDESAYSPPPSSRVETTEKAALIPNGVGAVANGGPRSRAEASTLGYGSMSGHATSTAEDSGSLDYSHAHARHHNNDPSDSVDNHHHHRHHHNEQMSDRHSSLRALLLLLALSLHSLFEGLALGLLTSNSIVISIFSALMIHKLVMGFSLGLNLVQSNLSVRAIIGSIAFFSVTSPIGAIIGIVLAELYQTPLARLVCGCLQAVACGTFLYVTFFEVLPHEMNAGGERLLKVLCIILGFSLIATMMLILPHA